MGNQQSVKEPKPNLSTLGAVSSIRSSRKPRVPKDSRILGSNNIFTEHHGESRDDRKGPSWITQNGKHSHQSARSFGRFLCLRKVQHQCRMAKMALYLFPLHCREELSIYFSWLSRPFIGREFTAAICVVKLHKFIIGHYRPLCYLFGVQHNFINFYPK